MKDEHLNNQDVNWSWWPWEAGLTKQEQYFDDRIIACCHKDIFSGEIVVFNDTQGDKISDQRTTFIRIIPCQQDFKKVPLIEKLCPSKKKCSMTPRVIRS